MPAGYIEYVEPMLEKSRTNEYNRQYYQKRQHIILEQRRKLYQQKKLIPQIEVDFTKK